MVVGNFLWAIGQVITNAYVLYKKNYKRMIAKKMIQKKRRKLEPMMDHLTFRKELVEQLMFPEMSMTCKDSTQLSNNGLVENNAYLKKVRASSITSKSLRHKFPCRFDAKFHPFIEERKHKYCQYCRYKKGKRVTRGGPRGGNVKYKCVSRCLTCNVNLCSMCFSKFHGIDISSCLVL